MTPGDNSVEAPGPEGSREPDEGTRTGTRTRRIAAILGAVVLVAAVAPFVAFAVPQVVGADHGFVVLSGSMEPSISPGDVVFVASGPVGVGDVVTYQTGNDVPTTHRVVEAVDGAYRTKGDANENADRAMVQPDQLLGRVVFVVPLIGHVILWVNTPVGFALLVVAPLLVLGAMEARRFLGESADGPDGDPTTDPVADATGRTAASVDAVTVEATERRAPDRNNDGDLDTDLNWNPETDRDTDFVANSDPDTVSEPAPGRNDHRTVVVEGIDLAVTVWMLLAFAVYAGYVLVEGVLRTGVPGPIHVAVFTGVSVAFLLVATLTGRERLRARRRRRESTPRRSGVDGPPDTDADSDGVGGGD